MRMIMSPDSRAPDNVPAAGGQCRLLAHYYYKGVRLLKAHPI